MITQITVIGTNRIDEREVVTVALSNDKPTEQKEFHCIRCGKIVFSYFNDVKLVTVDQVVESKKPIDIFCSRCGMCHRVV